ncbi:nascent polypeptide-associated complex subunit alpha, muscle-specific form-like, partial [Oxyura jamaicensis]|uniref:nascent polypeptide-associated complex subunit alpha, muscle-specific form-like n=1 Tax=Oxyura jamaicensis TaxID=8884 RepID=UPI0015A67B45
PAPPVPTEKGTGKAVPSGSSSAPEQALAVSGGLENIAGEPIPGTAVPVEQGTVPKALRGGASTLTGHVPAPGGGLSPPVPLVLAAQPVLGTKASSSAPSKVTDVGELAQPYSAVTAEGSLGTARSTVPSGAEHSAGTSPPSISESPTEPHATTALPSQKATPELGTATSPPATAASVSPASPGDTSHTVEPPAALGGRVTDPTMPAATGTPLHAATEGSRTPLPAAPPGAPSAALTFPPATAAVSEAEDPGTPAPGTAGAGLLGSNPATRPRATAPALGPPAMALDVTTTEHIPTVPFPDLGKAELVATAAGATPGTAALHTEATPMQLDTGQVPSTAPAVSLPGGDLSPGTSSAGPRATTAQADGDRSPPASPSVGTSLSLVDGEKPTSSLQEYGTGTQPAALVSKTPINEGELGTAPPASSDPTTMAWEGSTSATPRASAVPGTLSTPGVPWAGIPWDSSATAGMAEGVSPSSSPPEVASDTSPLSPATLLPALGVPTARPNGSTARRAVGTASPGVGTDPAGTAPSHVIVTTGPSPDPSTPGTNVPKTKPPTSSPLLAPWGSRSALSATGDPSPSPDTAVPLGTTAGSQDPPPVTAQPAQTTATEGAGDRSRPAGDGSTTQAAPGSAPHESPAVDAPTATPSSGSTSVGTAPPVSPSSRASSTAQPGTATQEHSYSTAQPAVGRGTGTDTSLGTSGDVGLPPTLPTPVAGGAEPGTVRNTPVSPYAPGSQNPVAGTGTVSPAAPELVTAPSPALGHSTAEPDVSMSPPVLGDTSLAVVASSVTPSTSATGPAAGTSDANPSMVTAPSFSASSSTSALNGPRVTPGPPTGATSSTHRPAAEDKPSVGVPSLSAASTRTWEATATSRTVPIPSSDTEMPAGSPSRDTPVVTEHTTSAMAKATSSTRSPSVTHDVPVTPGRVTSHDASPAFAAVPSLAAGTPPAATSPAGTAPALGTQRGPATAARTPAHTTSSHRHPVTEPQPSHGLGPAVSLYPFGAEGGDREWVRRTVDFNSPLFKPEIGFPFGKALRDSLYVSVCEGCTAP